MTSRNTVFALRFFVLATAFTPSLVASTASAGSLSCTSTDTCRDQLTDVARAGRRSLGYDTARERLFQYVDAFSRDGKRFVISVYSPDVFSLPRSGIPHGGVNTEHTWPRVHLKRDASSYTLANTDLHHLFPSEIRINSERSSEPFAECPGDSDEEGWLCDDGFEPPNRSKGAVARAMFYMAVAYEMELPDSQERILRQWHKDHPVTQFEIGRHSRVHESQGNINPFIEHPEWVDLLDNF